MRLSLSTVVFGLHLSWTCQAFLSMHAARSKLSPGNDWSVVATATKKSDDESSARDDSEHPSSSRRDLLQKTVFTATSWALALNSNVLPAAADEPSGKILLLGGTGLVGSKVRSLLLERGIPIVATSRDGRDGTVAWDVTTSTNVAKDIESLAKGCSAVISTVGVLGTPQDAVVNAANGLAAAGAKAAGVSRFVYITVSPLVQDFAKDVDLFKDYMQGKSFARDAVIHYFGNDNENDYTLIEPTFIYGGDKFQLNPPRVNSLYGSIVEGVLASGPLRAASSIAPPGLVKVALLPPVSAQAVAKAAVAGALGKTDRILDTYDKINAAAANLL